MLSKERELRRRKEDNIRMDFDEICKNAGNWVDSAQDRDYWRALMNVALKLRLPWAMDLVSRREKNYTSS